MLPFQYDYILGTNVCRSHYLEGKHKNIFDWVTERNVPLFSPQSHVYAYAIFTEGVLAFCIT